MTITFKFKLHLNSIGFIVVELPMTKNRLKRPFNAVNNVYDIIYI